MLILAFEVIVQPPKTQFLTFSKVQKTHYYGEKKWDQNHEKQLVPDRVLPRLNILLFPYSNVLIKKQSKDETTIEILESHHTNNEKAVKVGKTFTDALSNIVQTLLPAIKPKKEFDPDEFYGKLLQYPLYEVNQSWTQDFSVMSCPAQVFKERFSIQGEFFDSYL